MEGRIVKEKVLTTISRLVMASMTLLRRQDLAELLIIPFPFPLRNQDSDPKRTCSSESIM